MTSIKRWVDILSYGLVGGAFAVYLGQHLDRRISQAITELFGGSAVGSCALLLIFILTIFALHRFCNTRFRHFCYLGEYPPLPVAIICAFAIAPLLPEIQEGKLAVGHLPWEVSALLATSFLLVWCLLMSFNYLKSSPNLRSISTTLGIPAEEESVPYDRLREWVNREEAISDRLSDLFGSELIANQLFERLVRGENTVALQGSFGSGKSSVAAMTRQIATTKHAPLIFVQVSCWGFEDAAKAQDEILAGLVREIGKEVDTLSVRDIPARYLDAVGEHAGWLQSVFKLSHGALSPLEQLQRLSPILGAISRTAVVFIEDVDRNTKDFDISQIQSLLVRLRDVKGLSFVLSVSPLQRVDFSKLCDFIEWMPDLKPAQSLPLIQKMREQLLLEHPVEVILDKLEPLESDGGEYGSLYQHFDYYRPWSLALCDLLRTPRTLKHAMRRVSEAWPALRGEVKIDDLIGICALRIGSPEAFEFFFRRQDQFAAAAKPPTPNLREDARTAFREELKNEWGDICGKANFDSRAAARVMHVIAPQSGAVTGENSSSFSIQSMRSERRGSTYARRLLTERLQPGENRDQVILSFLKGSSEPSKLRSLAEIITDSKPASDAFEDFAPHMDFKGHLPLLSEVYECIRLRQGPRVVREKCHGFFAPWRLVRRSTLTQDFEQWLVGELEKCVPSNLHLLNEIYYFWLGTDEHRFEERLGPRIAVQKRLRDIWLGSSPDVVASGFDPDFPYVLFHLVFTSDYRSRETVPLGKAEDWSWAAPALLDAMRQAPNVMVPQILFAVQSPSSKAYEALRYEYDEEILRLWFGEKTTEVMSIIADRFTPLDGFTAQIRYIIDLAVEKARDRLPRS